MAAQLDRTIVRARRKEASARFLAELLGLPAPKPVGHFLAVELANGVALDFMDTQGEVAPRHHAFRVDEVDFEAILARLEARGIVYLADPGRRRPGEIGRRDGRRGLYFEDPDGHFLEALTRPCGSGT